MGPYLCATLGSGASPFDPPMTASHKYCSAGTQVAQKGLVRVFRMLSVREKICVGIQALLGV